MKVIVVRTTDKGERKGGLVACEACEHCPAPSLRASRLPCRLRRPPARWSRGCLRRSRPGGTPPSPGPPRSLDCGLRDPPTTSPSRCPVTGLRTSRRPGCPRRIPLVPLQLAQEAPQSSIRHLEGLLRARGPLRLVWVQCQGQTAESRPGGRRSRRCPAPAPAGRGAPSACRQPQRRPRAPVRLPGPPQDFPRDRGRRPLPRHAPPAAPAPCPPRAPPPCLSPSIAGEVIIFEIKVLTR